MAGEKPLDVPDGDEELRKRKRLGELLGAARPESPSDKTARAFDLGKVAAETGGSESKRPKKKRPDHEAGAEEATTEATLTADEQAAAERQILDARKEAVSGELENADASAIPVIEADAAYLGDVDSRVRAGEPLADAVESAFAAEAGLTDNVPIEGEFGDGNDAEGEVLLRSGETTPSDGEAAVDAGTGAQPDAAESRPVRDGADTASAAETIVPAVIRTGAEVAAAGGIVALLAGAFVANRLKQNHAPERRVRAMQRSFERQLGQMHEQLVVHEEQIRRLSRERTQVLAAAGTMEATHVAPKVEQKPLRPEVVHTNAPVPDIETMALRDVLDLAQNIRVDAKSLRQIYEEGRISQRGLRRGVETYLHNGNLRQVLKQELLIKAIAMELDPVLRDRPPESAVPAAAVSQPAIDSGANAPGVQAAPSTESDHAAVREPAVQNHQVSTPLLVIANIIALIILGTLLIVLFTILIVRK